MSISSRACNATLALAVILTNGAAAADDFVMERPGSPDSETLVIGGRRVQDARQWPATFKFGKGDKEFCTATAIGPRVILTAAHCLPDGASGHVVINDVKVNVACYHHPEYTPCPKQGQALSSCPSDKTTSADYALCVAKSGDLPISTYETVNVRSSVPARESPAILTGYGCNKDGGKDGGFGYLFEGDTKVDELPNRDGAQKWEIYYIVTTGEAAVCFGDSGGPSYKMRDAVGKSRLLIGVNSRSNMKKDDLSYLSATSVDSFKEWAANWAHEWEKVLIQESNGALAADFSVQICGIHSAVRNCHP